jgi:PAS domain S-box-containing protein
MKLGLRQKVLLVIAIPLAFELTFIAILGVWLDAAYRQNDRIQHCRAIVAASQSVTSLFYDATRFLAFYSLKRDEASKAKVEETIAQIPQKFAEMEQLAKNNPREKAAIKEAHHAAKQMISRMRAVLAKAESEGLSLTDIAIARDIRVGIQEELEDLSARMKAINEREAAAQKASPGELERARLAITELLLAGIVINTIIALLTAFAFSKTILDKIEVLSSNAQRFAGNEPLLEPIGGSDEISKFDEVFHQMTRKMAELERHESAMIANAVDLICAFNGNGQITAASPSSEIILGCTPEELLGSDLETFVVTDGGANSLLCELKSSISTNKEVTLRRKDGVLVDTIWSSQWVETEQELFCTIHDVSEKKRVERLKRELVGMVSHELKTPLSSIRALFELLSAHRYGQISDKGISRIASLDLEALRLIRLINDLLDLEKMEAGKLELKCSNCFIDEVAKRSFDSVSDLAERRNLNLHFDADRCEVFADSERIIQVMINFLSNAIKFSPTNKEIWFKVKQEGENVRCAVIDEAGGIPIGMEEKIFQRFEQSRSEDASIGSGLGLSIAQTIVELHGGTMGVINNPGVGSEFWFLIPCAAMEAPPAAV